MEREITEVFLEKRVIYINQHESEWVEAKYSIGDRRVLLTKWVGQAKDNCTRTMAR
jgi:hypothetical protein